MHEAAVKVESEKVESRNDSAGGLARSCERPFGDLMVDYSRPFARIAYGDHPTVAVEPGDTVIISAKPVPGNELRVHDSINQLARAGAEVLHEEIAPVHVSGHAYQEELRTMLSLLRPRYVMPIHGEYRMLAAHAKLAREAGVPDDRILLADNGTVVELSRGGARIVDRVEAGVTFVDGLRVGDVQDVALRDRRRLADDGVLIVVTTLASSDGGEVAPPELIARGFAESSELLGELRSEADRVVQELASEHGPGEHPLRVLAEFSHCVIGITRPTRRTRSTSTRHGTPSIVPRRVKKPGVGSWIGSVATNR